ncbi:hypothetical protein RHMOL_Rhmol08G0305800 [Rhododendron molle]|uniref:Uncharacterized protein n=1 Tax=Rhododendron molle TaxID=49168 RepID=A0ACC0MV89_RHOML|nr:hypothetical protein RHMOL_Rhmol08G0305800 [Rhododendron molle]
MRRLPTKIVGCVRLQFPAISGKHFRKKCNHYPYSLFSHSNHYSFIQSLPIFSSNHYPYFSLYLSPIITLFPIIIPIFLSNHYSNNHF